MRTYMCKTFVTMWFHTVAHTWGFSSPSLPPSLPHFLTSSLPLSFYFISWTQSLEIAVFEGVKLQGDTALLSPQSSYIRTYPKCAYIRTYVSIHTAFFSLLMWEGTCPNISLTDTVYVRMYVRMYVYIHTMSLAEVSCSEFPGGEPCPSWKALFPAYSLHKTGAAEIKHQR